MEWIPKFASNDTDTHTCPHTIGDSDPSMMQGGNSLKFVFVLSSSISIYTRHNMQGANINKEWQGLVLA